ncbi:hypothetical protein D3C86_1468660 [compost metagenome]
MATTNNDLDCRYVAGVIALDRSGPAQHHATDRNGAVLTQGRQIPAAEGPLELDTIVAVAEIGLDRAVHAATAELFEFAPQLGQGDALRLADITHAVVEKVHVLELFGQGHWGALLRRGRDRADEWVIRR